MIPVNIPFFSGNEKKYLNECLDTGWVSSEGAFVKRLEEEFAHYVDRKFGITVANGSAALDIAVKAIGIQKGDEVIMPTFTIISPALSVVREGGIPVLVDSVPTTWNMDVEKIEGKITSKTKAIIVVHIYGLPVDMNPVIEIARKYNLKIIEDSAEVHGQTYHNKKCGSFGDISTFSFYANKNITTGEGGIIVTDDEELAEKCQSYRNLCFQNFKRFVHEELGWNYRMTNMQAALGVAQLEKIQTHIEMKKTMGRIYENLLSDIEGFHQPVKEVDYAENIYWIYGLVAKDQKLCDEVVDQLKERKIGTRPFFWCIHEQPVFKKMGLFQNESYPVAEKLARTGFYIPSGLGTTEQQMIEVASSIKEILKTIR